MQKNKRSITNSGDSHFPQGDDKGFVTSLFNQSIDGIMVIDSEGMVQLANPKAKALFKPLVDSLEGYIFGVPALSGSVEIQVHHTGEPRTIEMRTKEIDWQGEIAYLAFLRDITERVQAQENLRENEQKYRQLFDNAINGFFLSEVVRNEKGDPIDAVLVDINEAFEQQIGLSEEEVLNKPLSQIYPGFHETVILEVLERVSRTGEAERFEYFFEILGKHFLVATYPVDKDKVGTIFSDITDRVKAEEQLRKSGERYRTLYEIMTQGVIYMDPESRVISINPAGKRILGMDEESCLGEKIESADFEVLKLDMTPVPDYRLPHRIALRTGRSIIDCVMGVKRSQQVECIWLNISAIPQFHEGEEDPYQVIVIFLDVTDRIRVQKAFQERVKELRCISEISSVIQRDPDFDDLCQITVQELVKAMRYSDIAVAVVELAGLQCDSGGYSETLMNCIEAPIYVSGGKSGRVAVYYQEDKEFIVPEEQNLLKSVAERLASYYERRNTHDQLRKSEERFRRAIMDAPIPILIFAEDGEIITINHAWLQNSGYTLADLPTISDWLQKAHYDQFEEMSDLDGEEHRAGYCIEEEEYSIRKKDGEQRLWLITTALLETLPDGRKTFISMARDITERKQAEMDRERYYNRIMALREVDKVIGSTLDLDSVLDRITSQLQRLIEFDSMSVMLIDEDQMEIIACQGFEKPEEILGITFPSDPAYPNYEVYEQKKPVCYENISEVYPEFTQPVDEDISTVIKTWLGVPLIHQEEVIGMFTIDRAQENLFSEEDISIAMEFANRAAIAITNAQLYEQTRAQVEKLEILRNIDAAITGNMNLNDTLMEILRYTKEGLNVDAATIILYDEEKDVPTFEQGVGFKSEIRSQVEIDPDSEFCGYVARERKPVYMREIKFKGKADKYLIDIQKEGMRSYYALPLIAKGKLEGILQLFNREPIEPDEDWIDFANALAAQAAVALYNISLFKNLEEANESLIQAYDATIEGWAHALELRDKETEGHSRHVVDLTLKIAKTFGFGEDDLHHIRRGVLLHDIGKMGIPDEILRKPGPLSERDWDMMRQHPVFAYDMLKEIDYLKPALRIPHYHHERWNGSGYPEGLKGDEIPLEARIFAVVDIWDALLSDRYYRDAWTREEALRYIKSQAGILLDPEVVAVFLKFVEGNKAEVRG